MRKGLIAGLLAASLCALAPLAAWQATPEYIPLQGQLTEQSIAGGGNIVAEDGVYTITVRVYESPTGSGAIWDDTFENLPVVNGVFNMVLGSQRSLDAITGGSSGEDLLDRLAQRGVMYVGLVITHKDGTAVPQPVEMLPRLTLLPVALSLKSKEAINSQLLDNKHWDLFFNGTLAKNAEKVRDRDWSDLLVLDNTTTKATDPANDGSEIRPALLPPATITPAGSLLRAGTILEQYGGMIDQVIDPRSLDTGWDPVTNTGGDGIPDKHLSEGKNLSGDPVTTNYGTWFVCVQNGANNMRLPDPDVDGLDTDVKNSYSIISSSLRGTLVPRRSLTAGLSDSDDLTWNQLLAQPGSPSIPANDLVPDAMTYDPVLDGYWTLGPRASSDFYLIYRNSSAVDDDGNDSTYRYRAVTVSDVSWGHHDDVNGMAVVQIASNGDRYLVVPPRTSVHNLYTLKIQGSTPETASLTGLQQFSSVNGPMINFTNRGWYGFAHDPALRRLHVFYGQVPGGSLTNNQDVYSLSDLGLPLGVASNTAPGSTGGAQIGFAGGTYRLADGGVYSYGSQFTDSHGGLSVYDTVDANWAKFLPGDVNGDPPSDRANPVLFIHPKSSEVGVWGGMLQGGGSGENSLYFYNPETATWRNVPSEAGWPVGRTHAGYTFDSARERLIIYGGRTEWSSGDLGQIWELDFGGKTVTKGYIIKADGDSGAE